MELGIRGKVAVVTGASQGLGRAMARQLGSHGARLILGSRGKEAGERSAAALRSNGVDAVFHRTDITRSHEADLLMERAADEFGRVDFMINNAGIFMGGGPTEMPIADWNAVLDVNLNGTFHGCRAAAQRMIEQGEGGRIVNISSIIGVVGKLHCSAYTASKAAVNGLTRNLAIDLAPHGILVNAVVPGVCDSEINAHVTNGDRRRSEAKIPLGRWAEPSEIAAGVVFLCSNLATYVTGTTLVIDGGYLTGSEIRADDSIL